MRASVLWRLFFLLALSMDSSFTSVHGAYIAGNRIPLVPQPAATPTADDGHYRTPLVDLCEKGTPITLSDLRTVAPQVFLRLIKDENWKDVILNPTKDTVSVLIKLIAMFAKDPAFQKHKDCEQRILSSVFPSLSQAFSEYVQQQNFTQSGSISLLDITKNAIIQSIGTPQDTAKIFNKLQDELNLHHPKQFSGRVVDAEKTVERLVEAQTLLAEISTATEGTVVADSYVNELARRSEPVPMNKGDVSERAKSVTKINYDEFARQILTVVKINSGLIIFICYATAAYDLFNLMSKDTDGEFVQREQMRTGKEAILDTNQVERDPNVGSSTIVQGANAIDYALYGANYPVIGRIPTPGQSEEFLRASVLKGNEKILYQSLDAQGKLKFKTIFGHMPAPLYEGEITGVIEDGMNEDADLTKKVGIIANSPELKVMERVRRYFNGAENAHPELETKVTPMMNNVAHNDIAGFVGSLKMKILRAYLNGGIGEQDLEFRVEAMKLGWVSIEDIISLIYWIEQGAVDLPDEVSERTTKLIEEFGSTPSSGLCYCKGETPDALLTIAERAVLFPDDYCSSLCKLNPKSDKLMARIDSTNSLISIKEIDREIREATTGIGLTPGQQLQMSQVNTATRIDKLFTSVNSVARINFALLIASYLKDSWINANRLYDMSKRPCTDRDPDEMTLFWNVPIPAPACPVYGVSYFPEWLEWLAGRSKKSLLFSSDPLGKRVEYMCLTGIQPDPMSRQINYDNNPTELRLSGKQPSCVEEPSQFNCFYRSTPFIGRQCLATASQGSDLERYSVEVLPGGLEWSSTVGTNNCRWAKFKVMGMAAEEKFSCQDGEISTTVNSDFTFYELSSSPSCSSSSIENCRTSTSTCERLCIESGTCETYFTETREGLNLCYLFDTIIPASTSSRSGTKVCIKQGFNMYFLDVDRKVIASHLFDEVAVSRDRLIPNSTYRYLDILMEECPKAAVAATQTQPAVPATNELKITITPMYRYETNSYSEENFRWIKGSQSIRKTLIESATLPRAQFVGLRCSSSVKVKDLCYLRKDSLEPFLYPSEPFDKIEFKDVSFPPLATDTNGASTARASAFMNLVEIEKSEDKPTEVRKESFWSEIEEKVWGKKSSEVSQEPNKGMIGIPHVLIELFKGQNGLSSLLDQFQGLISTAMSKENALGQLLAMPAMKVVKQELSQKEDSYTKLLDTFREMASGSKTFTQMEQALTSFASQKLGFHSDKAAALGAQTLIQGSALWPTDPTTINGPATAANLLMMLYIAGSIVGVLYLLIKNQDRVNPKNNLTIRDYQVFNPALAVLPGGAYGKQYGSSAQATLLSFLVVILSTTIGIFKLARFTMEEGAKANDALSGLN